MAKKLREVEEVISHINNGNNFVLQGGAGSGKTYSLVEIIKEIYKLNRKATLACITFTNVAVNEIKERAPYDNMWVSTIHDFLWDNIKLFQRNLKKSLIDLIKDEQIKVSNKELFIDSYFDDKEDIAYREWLDVQNGIISHDEILLLSEHMFANYSLLSDILIDKYDYIFIDEYQDTHKPVIKILLEHLKKSKKKNVLGFFGDPMQSIYRDGGDYLSDYLGKEVQQVIKSDNRRNPTCVVSLANRLRSDDVKQEPAKDEKAPNYKKDGDIKILSFGGNIQDLKKDDIFSAWDFSNSKETKELYLTHNLIAPNVGFPCLMEIYDKDRIIKYKQEIRNYIKDNNITIEEGKTFGDVINITGVKPSKTGKTVADKFIEDNRELFAEAKGYLWKDFSSIYLEKDKLIGKKKINEFDKQKGDTRDRLIEHLINICECIFLYNNKRFNDFIKKTHFVINSIEDKKKLKDYIAVLSNFENLSIEEVLEYAHSSNIWKKNDKLNSFIKEKQYLYNRVKKVSFNEIYNLYGYIEDYTPFSTQHNIKGAEFKNVLLVLDNGKWSDYNFQYLFNNTPGKESIIERTRKLFYVCCTRAMENLVIVLPEEFDTSSVERFLNLKVMSFIMNK